MLIRIYLLILSQERLEASEVSIMGSFGLEYTLPDLAYLGPWQKNKGSNLDKWNQGKDIKQVSSLQTFSVFDIHMENGINILPHHPGQFDNFY